MAFPELSPDGLTLQVSSIRQKLDNATNLEEIREIVIETGTLVGEDKMPKLIAVFLACHAQTQLSSLKNKQ